MNQALLRHFQEYRPDEKQFLEKWKSGKPVVLHEVFVDSTQHLREGKQIEVYQELRFVHNVEHTHNFVEIAYSYAGQSTHLVNHNEVILRTGELLVMNQHVTHKEMPLGGNDILIYFVVLPHFFAMTLDMMSDSENSLREFLVSCLHNKEQSGGYLHFKVADVMPIQNLLENLMWSLVYGARYSRGVNQFTMGLLFLNLLNYTDKAHAGTKQEAQIYRILQYMDEHYIDGCLDALAKLLGYSMDRMSVKVKHLTGSTFKQLQQNKRMAQAKFLLSSTNLPIIEIARRVGYSDSSHFHRLFRQQEGFSPKDYRDGLNR